MVTTVLASALAEMSNVSTSGISLVQASAPVLLGSIAPNGVTLGRVESFSVSGGVVSIPPESLDWAAEVSAWTWVGQVTAGNKILSTKANGMARLLISEQESITLRARPTDEEGAVVYVSDVETAMVSVFDTSRAAKSTPVYQEELVVADVAFSSLRLDKGWRQDKTGYSFKYQLPAGVLIEGGRVYRVELVLRTFSGGPRIIVWEVETSPVWTARSALGV